MEKRKGLVQIKKELKEITDGRIHKYEFKVVVYTCSDNDRITSDLEIEIFRRNGEYIDSITCKSIEGKEVDFWEQKEQNEKALLKDKKAIYNGLFKNYGECVIWGEDYHI